MAKATAICTCSYCGDKFKKKSIANNGKSGDFWIKWAKENYTICPECEQKEIEKIAVKYAILANEEDLPKLNGSIKQITWAEVIRHDKIIAINNFIDSFRDNEKYAESVKILEDTFNYILSKDSAGWWIDNRDKDSKNLLHWNQQAAKDAKIVQTVKNIEKEKI